MRGALFASVMAASALLLATSPAAACTPVWAHPGGRAEWSTIYVARVVSVNWFLGRVQVERMRLVKGEAPKRETLRYDNEPFSCGMQSFRKGETVFVFADAEFRFVTEVDYVEDPTLLSLVPAGAK